MEISLLPEEFCICRLEAFNRIPDWALSGSFYSVTRTPEELSIVCGVKYIPPYIHADKNWHVMKIEGPLKFSQTGILLSLVKPLTQANVSVLAISTYDTDYLMIKKENLSRALEVLQLAGHDVKILGH